MAVDGYTPITINPDQCIGNTELSEIFQSLQALYNDSLNGSEIVKCVPVDSTLTQTIGGGEACETLIPGAVVPATLTNFEQKQIFLYTGSSVWSIVDTTAENLPDQGDQTQAGTLIRELNFSMSCDDEQIISPTNSVYVGHASYICSPGSTLEFCIDPEVRRVGGTNTTSGLTGSVSVRICGSILTFDLVNINTGNVFVPCEVKEGCCYGSEALELIKQNLNSLCDSYRFGGQTRQTNSLDFADNQPHVLDAGFTGPTTWVVQGAISFCVRNTRPVPDSGFGAPSYLTINPSIGCSGENGFCLPSRFTVYPDEQFCISAPVQSCGECNVGDQLEVQFSQIAECNEVASPVLIESGGDLEVTNVRQDYCVTTYTNIDNELQPITRPVNCLTNDLALEITEKAEAIHQAACDREGPSCETIGNCTDGPIGGDHEVVPPQVVIPPDLPFNRNWYVTGYVQVCASTTGTLEENRTVFASYQIKCGGNVVGSGGRSFVFTGSGAIFQRCISIPIVLCVSCPNDQPIVICPDGVVSGGASNTLTFSSCTSAISLG